MAFSHDMFTFLIVCFIIPQLIIVQAQNENREGNRRERNRLEGNECEDDRDCLNGQICDDEEKKCWEERNIEFRGKCERNAGKFLLFFL